MKFSWGRSGSASDKQSNNYPWLYDHRRNVTSQTGEDGVLKAIFDRIGVVSRWCVDIGAGDGLFISNTWRPINEDRWSATLIEADPSNFAVLKERYKDRLDVHCLNEFVTPENSLDKLLASTPIPKKFDLLSIDIDGMDYWMWHGLKEYSPRVVVIETNCTMDTDIDFVQHDPKLRFGTSSLAMVKLARSKGYELVAHLVSNCIFVKAEEFSRLQISDNSLRSLFTSPFVPKVVSDINGVHYILKEGVWGFSGAIHANNQRPREDGMLCAERLSALGSGSNGQSLPVSPGHEHGFVASVEQDPDLWSVVRNFVSRMKEAYPRFRKL